MKNKSLIVGVECAKDHSGSHILHRNGKFAECQGCLEYYTFLEVSEAKPNQTMLARGLRSLPVNVGAK